MNIIQIPFWHWINLFSLLFPGHHGDFILDKQHFYSISKNWYAASSAPACTPDRQILGSELRVCHNGGRWAVAVCICPAGCFYVVVKPPYRLPIFLCLPTIIAAQDLLHSAEIKTLNQSQSISSLNIFSRLSTEVTEYHDRARWDWAPDGQAIMRWSSASDILTPALMAPAGLEERWQRTDWLLTPHCQIWRVPGGFWSWATGRKYFRNSEIYFCSSEILITSQDVISFLSQPFMLSLVTSTSLTLQCETLMTSILYRSLPDTGTH